MKYKPNNVKKRDKINHIIWKIINYIKIYPLKTKKHLSYLRWLKVYGLVKDKHHPNSEGIE